ncbi:tRNA-specific 2-thiouridylase MnmA [bioreactor metagenome]|uniref:tRNA-specific 2-thiouridylase MnmA n=1 Tax=bioreactor metagenome TaxID=1076179 RepID=A0A645J870_9ZZZZ
MILGREKEQYTKRFMAKEVHFIAFDALTSDMRVKAKIRYKHQEMPAIMSPVDANTVMVEFEESQKAVTSGQSVVFYEDDYVVGGGKIV